MVKWYFWGLKLTSMRALGLTLVLLLLLSSCGTSQCREDAPDPISVDLTIERTETELFESKDLKEVYDFLQKYPELAQQFWHNYQYPNDQILARQIFMQVSHPTVKDTVYTESIKAFEASPDFEASLEEVIGRLKAYFPEAKTPDVKTAITVFYNDLVVSDSLIIIGLDHFVGAKSTYAPPVDLYPEYVLRRYNYEHLPSLISFFLAGQFVSPGEENSLLSEMIDFGKTYYLASRLQPCAPDSVIIGFTDQNMVDIGENREIIWANFVENQILYTTDHQIKKKFLDERPNVYEIGEKCPGRIGAWVGWEIVEEYMANNDVSVQELVRETNHHMIFEKSGYKPKSD